MRQVRQELGSTSSLKTDELESEQAFCLNVCAWSRHVEEFGEDLLRHAEGTKVLPDADKDFNFISVFKQDFLFDASHVKTVLRNLLKLMLGFAIGYAPAGGIR